MLSMLPIVWLLCSTMALAAIGPVANMFIANDKISPDGFTRSAVLAGSSMKSLTFPGPLVTANKGDKFRLNVIDQLTDPTMLTTTSIHWHGLFQQGSSWADGPVGVTQCPIIPGESFLYQFSSTDQAGTYWYHSHHSTQYCDGLRGGLVIYDPNDPHKNLYDFDDESTVITLADWYHKPAPSVLVPGRAAQFDATLINGLGRYPGSKPDGPLSVIKVLPNKRYRFRLISISCDPNFIFSIDNHNLTIIEVDGVNVKPLIVDSIQIFAGQRYSFVLNANKSPSSYWVRALPNPTPVNSNLTNPFQNGQNSAILRYQSQGVPNTPQYNTPPPLINPMLETNLHPFIETPVPGGKNGNVNKINLQVNFTGGHYHVNDFRFSPPVSYPVLLQLLSGIPAQNLMPNGSIYELPPNEVIELSFTGADSAGSPHPIHLHGHNFHVVRSADSNVYNYDDPVIRDVVSMGRMATDKVTIRFKTDNPGPWILHCHIDWHFELGLAVVFAENARGILKQNHPPASWDKLCKAYNAFQPPKAN